MNKRVAKKIWKGQESGRYTEEQIAQAWRKMVGRIAFVYLWNYDLEPASEE